MFKNRQRNGRSENTRRLYLLKDGELGHLEMVRKRWEVGIIFSVNSVQQKKSGIQSLDFLGNQSQKNLEG